MQELRRRPVDDGVDGPEEGAPALVVEHQDDGRLGQVVRVVPELTFLLTGVRHRSIERNFVRNELGREKSSQLIKKFRCKSFFKTCPGRGGGEPGIFWFFSISKAAP